MKGRNSTTTMSTREFLVQNGTTCGNGALGRREFPIKLKAKAIPAALRTSLTKTTDQTKTCVIGSAGVRKRGPVISGIDGRIGGGGGSSVTCASQNGKILSAAPLVTPHIQKVTFEGQVCHVGFVLHQVLLILQEQRGWMCVLDVEKSLREKGILGVDLSSQSDILNALKSHHRIRFDPINKRLWYANPFFNVTSAEALLTKIQSDGKITGVRVTDDLLNADVDMKKYINKLLRNRQIRCIRLNNNHLRGKKKCKFAGSGNECKMYAKTKCIECYENLKDLILYPLSNAEIEESRIKLDDDVKKLWTDIEIPSLDVILKEFKMEISMPRWEGVIQSNRKKRIKDDKTRATAKLRRIQNSHLFTVHELQQEADLHMHGF